MGVDLGRVQLVLQIIDGLTESKSYVKCQGRGNRIAHGRHQRSSNFYITINTNKTVGDVYNLKDTERAYIDKFEKVWK